MSITSPYVSFIVTCYNFENYIIDALQSILNQKTQYSFEVIVVDDCSKDNSATNISKIQDERLTFISNTTNKRAYACINQAFEMAKGTYICRFDGDDKWHEDFLETVVPIMERNEDVGMLFSNYIPLDAENNQGEEQKTPRPPSLQTKDNDFKAILKNYYINAPTIIFRREALKAAFPIPQKFGNFADWYLSLTVLQTWNSYYLDKALAYYRVHHNNNHRRAIKNKTDEQVTEILLESFVKDNPKLTEAEKNDIYAINYQGLAFKYYSVEMPEDAKKYFKKTLQYNKKYLLDSYFMRFMLISYFGKARYEKIKSMIK